MGFRSDEEALRGRVDALEGELAERDAEVARLRAELESEKQGPPKPPVKISVRLPRWSAPADPEPNGDVWELPLSASGWKAVLPFAGAAAVAFGFSGYYALNGGPDAEGAWIIAAIFGAPMLLLALYRGGVVIDRRARTITCWRWLFLRWATTVPLADDPIVVHKRLVQPDEGDSYWVGHIRLGERFLLKRKAVVATSLAKRMAKFADVKYGGERTQSTKELMRQAHLPLIITMTAMGIAMIGLLIWTLVRQ